MIFANVTNGATTAALEMVLSFAHQRHRVLAENVANLNTPGFATKVIDPRGFQRSLGEAMQRKGNDPNKPLTLAATKQWHMEGSGRLRITPTEHPVSNILFHAGTNASVEALMSDVAENAMAHELASNLLRGRYEGLRKAIRGQV